jgi:hypothetical protein
MKLITTVLCGFALFLISFTTQAQTTDYFVGEWEVTIKDTPMGTISVVLTLERGEDGKLVGKFVDAANSTSTPMTQITESEDSITLYFFAEGMDLYLNLKPEGEENVSGTLMDSFAIEGKRVKK